ncbi:phosphatase PAP2 family protein [Arthrobacter monumenti]
MTGLLTSLPVLVSLLIFITVLASGPLHGLDRALNQPWSEEIFPGWRSFVDDVVDPIASQAVVVPLLAVTAIVLSVRAHSWRPVMIAAATEIGVVGMVGAMKVIIARPSPVLGDPSFFHGGIFNHGGYGIIYPSGHAAQSVALYGVIVFLLSRYTSTSRKTLNLLSLGVAVIAALTMVSSIYLGWHWSTDLIAGFVTGGIVLRAVIYLNDMFPERPRPASPDNYSLRQGAYRVSSRPAPTSASSPTPAPAPTPSPAPAPAPTHSPAPAPAMMRGFVAGDSPRRTTR